MRYLIILLVVLSFVASFGISELESAQTVGAGRFSYTVGSAWNLVASFARVTDITPHAGVEFGLSESLSIILKSDTSFMADYDRVRFHGFNLSCSLKTSFDLTDTPFSLGFSLGGELYNRTTGYGWYGYYDDEDEYDNKTTFAGRGSVIFQAWFFYLGLKLNTDFSNQAYPNPSLILGFDIEFNDHLSMMIEIGAPSEYIPYIPCVAFGIETTF